ncbi:MAG: hypothetical protein IJZ78_03435 [Alistipes sp.]|nr:hypothetical protein [Alistipes sp.]MBQ8204852.1 hypothetical protein [Alistipes sp.]
MSIWLIISIAASLVATLLCLAILFGRGDWMISAIAFDDDGEKYDIKRLRIVSAVMPLVLLLFAWLDVWLEFSKTVSIVIILAIGICGGVLDRFWARNR